jgi:hypothetical protein
VFLMSSYVFFTTVVAKGFSYKLPCSRVHQGLVQVDRYTTQLLSTCLLKGITSTYVLHIELKLMIYLVGSTSGCRSGPVRRGASKTAAPSFRYCT